MSSIFMFLCLVSTITSRRFPPGDRFKPSKHENWKLLQNRNCGDASTTNRIIGGSEAQLGEYPWIAGLIQTQQNGQQVKYACSGTILNKKTILTAAHCVHSSQAGDKISYVVLGDWDKDIGISCAKEICSPHKQIIQPEEIIIHSRRRDYPNDNHQFDISLIRLKEDIEFNSYVFPICMLDDELIDRSFVKNDVTIAGWGISDPARQISSAIIQKVKLQVKDNSFCDSNTRLNYVMNEKQMCVGGSEGENVGPCQGDSGGPVMFKNETFSPPRTYLIGILSSRQIACEISAPTIATRVSSYMEWILDNLAESKKDFLRIDDVKIDIVID